ncbi:MAG: hypothetical protein CMJ58_17545 [Planctomycetaceae bacterium]|nr:hypothetical protein [Planctomycetaceae bacterium]
MIAAAEIAGLFFDSLEEIGELTAVGPTDMPEDYGILLAHDDHMTVTIEAFYGTLVDVQPLAEVSSDEFYARTSLLIRQSDRGIAQYGVMKIRLTDLPETVRQEIHAGQTPLGRVMIRHNLLRHVELRRLWRVKPGPQLRLHWDLGPDEVVYGRSAGIWVEGVPAVDLLEIVRA